MASSIKVPGKRLHPDNDSFQIDLKKLKFDHNNDDQLERDQGDSTSIDISSYQTPPPSTISDSCDRSVSPNDDIYDKSGNSSKNDEQDGKQSSDSSAGSSLPNAEDKNVDQLQNNVTYISLCSALSVLRTQREMIKKDILKLRDLQKQAMKDPESFIKQLSCNDGDIVNAIPKQVHIVNGDLTKLFRR